MLSKKCGCGKKAVTAPRYLNKAFCPKCFKRFFERRVKRTISRNRLLKRSDRIAVATSGGKDSLTALHLVDKFSKKIGAKRPEAIIINEGIADYREKTISCAENYCDKNDLVLHVFSFKENFGKSLDEIIRIKKKDQKPCSYCGVLRRWLLNKKALEMGFSKIVTGHNLDDEAQNVLMNVLRGDPLRLARLGAVAGVKPHPGFIPRIKPLRDSPEQEVYLYASIEGIHTLKIQCPNRTYAYRLKVKECVDELEDRFPGTKYSLLASLETLLPLLKEKLKKDHIPYVCELCGSPSSKKTCEACSKIREFSQPGEKNKK